MNKKGKRIFILLLTSIIAFTFASCGGKKTTEADAQKRAFTSFKNNNNAFNVLLPAYVKNKEDILRKYDKLPFEWGKTLL